MTNYYLDNEDLIFHLKQANLSSIVKFREKDFTDSQEYPEAPKDEAEALENYAKILELVGEIAGCYVAPRAAQVDRDGASLVDGEVIYAQGTSEDLACLKKADLMGFTLPRKFGGLNLPKTIYAMAIEMLSRADAVLMVIFGLQEISDIISKFGTNEQKERFLPRFCRGEVLGSMALTEPEAGSDLQAMTVMAKEQGNGKWLLNGVKRFISNGCAKISLILARSEENSTGGRGLSLFIYERDKNMLIRRIENKLGIHGSPTCELQFNNAEAEIIGQRKFGLIKYTMLLMNGARLAVSAQAIGIAEAAFREADKYARARHQFGKAIINFPAIAEMLRDMQVNIAGGRSFLYETARIVDIKEGWEELIEANPEAKKAYGETLKKYTRYAALFTPALKTYTTEMGNKVCYDAVQIHGGNGFMKDFNVERHFRDIRVTNIYEGTTQMQVVGAIGGIIAGTIFERLDEYERDFDLENTCDLFGRAKELRKYLERVVHLAKSHQDKSFQEYHERRIVEMACDVIISFLLCIDSLKAEAKKAIAKSFMDKAYYRVKNTFEFISQA